MYEIYAKLGIKCFIAWLFNMHYANHRITKLQKSKWPLTVNMVTDYFMILLCVRCINIMFGFHAGILKPLTVNMVTDYFMILLCVRCINIMFGFHAGILKPSFRKVKGGGGVTLLAIPFQTIASIHSSRWKSLEFSIILTIQYSWQPCWFLHHVTCFYSTMARRKSRGENYFYSSYIHRKNPKKSPFNRKNVKKIKKI